MASSQHVEVEAAKFLHKLIQESKDEPAKLATKLYVICEHMKMSGKEQSLPYQVISRAMETVISQHRLDIDVLRASRLPLTGGPQMGDSSHARQNENDVPEPSAGVDMPHKGTPVGTWHAASSSEAKEEPYRGTIQNCLIPEDCKAAPAVSETGIHEALILNRLPKAEPMRHDVVHQGSASQSQRSNKSSEHESPASVPMEDSRSANSQERRDSAKSAKQVGKRDTKKASTKRKRAESKESSDVHMDDIQQTDSVSTRLGSKKGKQSNRGDTQSHLSGKSGEYSHVGPVQQSAHMDRVSPLPSTGGALVRTRQESSHTLPERTMDKSKSVNPSSASHTSIYPEEGEVSSSHPPPGVKGGVLPSRPPVLSSMGVWSQNRFVSPSEISQGFVTGLADPLHRVINESIAPGLEMKRNMQGAEINGSHGNSFIMNTAEDSDRVSGGISGAFSSYATFKGGFSSPAQSTVIGHDLASKLHKDRNLDASSGPGVQSMEKGKNVVGTASDMDYLSVNFGSSKEATEFEHGRHGFMKDAVPGASEKFPEIHLGSARGSEAPAYLSSGSVSGHDGVPPHNGANPYAMFQGGGTRQLGKDNAPHRDDIDQRDSNLHFKPKLEATTRDMGATVTLQSPPPANMPFKEQHLKQLRAQCLVFLAFRNNVAPRKLHLEIALGECYPKEAGVVDGTHRGLPDIRGKVMSSKDPSHSYESAGLFGRPNDIRETEKEMPVRIQLGSSSSGSLVETESSSKDIENTKKKSKKATTSERSVSVEERQQQLAAKRKTEMTQLTTESHGTPATPVETESLANANRCISEISDKDSCDQMNQQGRWTNQALSSVLSKSNSLRAEGTMSSTTGFHAIAYKDATLCSVAQLQQESTSEVVINPQNQPRLFNGSDRANRLSQPEFSILDANTLTDRSSSSLPLKDQTTQIAAKELGNMKYNINPLRDVQAENLLSASEPVSYKSKNDSYCAAGTNTLNDQWTSDIQKQPGSDGLRTIIYSDTVRHGNLSMMVEKPVDQEEENKLESDDMPVSPPKFTTSEKWILEQQKRKHIEEERWALKQRKAEERISACFDKLKENVNASEEISARTRSVIELKKLQLLQLQRRLRSDFMNDFFKPITSDMERLKSVKKHRHGRRIKQLEKFEQKMKEERQKRIRERQKEFFGEIEVHKERLEDCFKVKRERCKGFNRYVKEFHKRKERIHREKIDRIQREKINLLKNNDVEGYLRMVQDAKSDRVKQLLKETEKYLQKLGAKIKEAKAMTRCFEMEMDASQAATVVEKNEVFLDPEDERDQAQHYLESNEKYYLMAHSVKETINEQPGLLLGGKLREYQMNGLRWLVSLYNNHLNGILADEMGLGKTVQVISLICYLMETKNDRGPFLVVVPSSVLPGWESEISFWAPGVNKIVYAGPPEERRRLFKDMIVHQKFNVLLTTYEYLMNKHDRPKLSKLHWHYIIIDEGHRIKNASCKLNADLKHYQSSHRLLLTGTPLQNNLEELWALLNFLLPNIFNSSEDFSQWFNKPFESNGDNSLDQALLSEEENLLIINRLHQVLRPFVLRRLKHKVENELPEKIERLVRCEASAYQKLLMKRVEDNLGSIGTSKGRSVHNTVMELRNICNHPYISHLHADEVDVLLPKHYLPPIVRLCGKLEMLDRLLPKLKATGHRVLFFSTMTRLLDVMEEYLSWKRYRYLRLDGHTSGNERGALIDEFNRPDSPTFIFLLSIRAGGVGVNLQAADTVIIFDTDWNPQVDLQAQARAHRIGQKRDVLVLRLETVHTVEEQVRASAEHKLGVANQSITAGFFDNNTSAEDRREYLESLLRECKKEEASPVLDDDALNDLLARSEPELDIFESVDKQRCEEEAATWQKLVQGGTKEGLEPLPMPPRLVTDEDLKPLYQAIRISETPAVGMKRKGEYLGDLDTQQYGRGKRAREVRSYEDQWTEEEFEKLCQADSPESPKPEEVPKDLSATKDSGVPKPEEIPEDLSATKDSGVPKPEEVPKDLSATKDSGVPKLAGQEVPPMLSLQGMQYPSREQLLLPNNPVSLSKEPPSAAGKENPAPVKRGRGRPKRATINVLSPLLAPLVPFEIASKPETDAQKPTFSSAATVVDLDPSKGAIGVIHNEAAVTTGGPLPSAGPAGALQAKGSGRKPTGETSRGRGRKQAGPGSATPHGRTRANRNCSPSIAPSISHEVNPISGLQTVAEFSTGQGPVSQQMAELPNIQGQCSSLGLGKHESISSASDKMEAGKVAQVIESKEAPSVLTESMYTVHGPCLIQSKKSDVPKTSTVQSMQEQMSKKSMPSVSLGSKDAKQNSLLMGSVETVIEKLKPSEKSGSFSLQSTENTVSVGDQSVGAHSNSVNYDKATKVDILKLKSENVRSQDTVVLSKSPETMSIGMKRETVVVATPSDQTSCSLVKRDNLTPTVRRGQEKKNSLTSKKAAARETKGRGTSVRSAGRGYAHLSGSGLMDGKESTARSVTMRGSSYDDGKQEAMTSAASCNLEERNPEHQTSNVLSSQKEHVMEKSEISAQSYPQVKLLADNGNATCSTTVNSSHKKSNIKSVEPAADRANVKIIETQPSCSSEIKLIGLLDAFESSRTGPDNLQAGGCSNQSQTHSIDNDSARVKVSSQNVSSDGTCGNHMSDNLDTAAISMNNTEVLPGGSKMFGVDTCECVAPFPAEQVSITINSSVEVPTNQPEENIAKSPCMIEAAGASEHTLPPLQIPAKKDKETASGESDGLLTSAYAIPDHPVTLARAHKFENKGDASETKSPIMGVVGELGDLARGGSKDIIPMESSMEREALTPSNLEVIRSAETREGETAFSNSSVDTPNVSAAAEFHHAKVEETKRDPAFNQESMSVSIHSLDICGTGTLSEDVIKEKYVPDLSLAGCSHESDPTIRKVQILEEGCSAGVLGGEFTESQSSSVAAVGSQAGQKEGLDDPEATSRKDETVLTVDDKHGTVVASFDSSAAASLTISIDKEIKCEQDHNIGCITKFGEEISSISSSAVLLSHRAAEVTRYIQGQPQELNSGCTVEVGAESDSVFTSVGSDMRNAAEVEYAQVQPVYFPVISQTAPVHGGISEPDEDAKYCVSINTDSVSVLPDIPVETEKQLQACHLKDSNLSGNLLNKTGDSGLGVCDSTVASLTTDIACCTEVGHDAFSVAGTILKEADDPIIFRHNEDPEVSAVAPSLAGNTSDKTDDLTDMIQEEGLDTSIVPSELMPGKETGDNSDIGLLKVNEVNGSAEQAVACMSALASYSASSEIHITEVSSERHEGGHLFASKILQHMAEDNHPSISETAQPTVVVPSISVFPDKAEPSNAPVSRNSSPVDTMSCSPVSLDKVEDDNVSVLESAHLVTVMSCPPLSPKRVDDIGASVSQLADETSPLVIIVPSNPAAPHKNENGDASIVEISEAVAAVSCKPAVHESHSLEETYDGNSENNDSLSGVLFPATVPCKPASPRYHSSEGACNRKEEGTGTFSETINPIADIAYNQSPPGLESLEASHNGKGAENASGLDPSQVIVATSCMLAHAEGCSAESACVQDEHVHISVSETVQHVAAVSCIQASLQEYTSEAACGSSKALDIEVANVFAPTTSIPTPKSLCLGALCQRNKDENTTCPEVALQQDAEVAEATQPVAAMSCCPDSLGDHYDVAFTSKTYVLRPEFVMSKDLQQGKVIDDNYIQTCGDELKVLDANLEFNSTSHTEEQLSARAAEVSMVETPLLHVEPRSAGEINLSEAEASSKKIAPPVEDRHAAATTEVMTAENEVAKVTTTENEGMTSGKSAAVPLAGDADGMDESVCSVQQEDEANRAPSGVSQQ